MSSRATLIKAAKRVPLARTVWRGLKRLRRTVRKSPTQPETPNTSETLITVAVSSFNGAAFLRSCLQSIQQQRGVAFECLIVDDCSVDGSLAVSQAFAKQDPRFRVIRHRANGGPSATRNTAIRAAKGQYLCFVDDDDILFGNAIADRAAALDNALADPDQRAFVAGAYCDHRSVDEADTAMYPSTPQRGGIRDFISHGARCPFVVHAPLCRTEILRQMGGFDESLRQAEDLELWARTMRHGYAFVPSNTVGVAYRQRKGSLVRRAPEAHLERAMEAFYSAYEPFDADDIVVEGSLVFRKPWTFYHQQLAIAPRVLSFVAMEYGRTGQLPDVRRLLEAEASPALLRHVDIEGIVRAGLHRIAATTDGIDGIDGDALAEQASTLAAKIREQLQTAPGTIRPPQRSATRPDPHFRRPASQRRVDIAFFPHKDYHVRTFATAVPRLEAAGLSVVVVDCTTPYRDERAQATIAELGLPSVTHGNYVLGEFEPGVILTMNDWDTVIKPVVETTNQEGKGTTVGLVEGVQDFWDVDTRRQRRPYQTVQHVLLAGRHDERFFPHDRTTVVGIPRIAALTEETPQFPEVPTVIVNSNFTYNVLTDKRKEWLESIRDACSIVGARMLVSRHPADLGDFEDYEVTELTMYDAIRAGSVFVSRFGSGIIEALAMGKPAIYHNPHGEKVDKFQESMGAYDVTATVPELAQALKTTLADHSNRRDKAQAFLEEHAAWRPGADLEHNLADALIALLQRDA